MSATPRAPRRDGRRRGDADRPVLALVLETSGAVESSPADADGEAISARVTGVLRTPGRDTVGTPRTVSLASPVGDAWPSLREVITRWPGTTSDAPPLVHVALLGVGTELRTVSLPPVEVTDARRLLERAPARHFRTLAAPVAVAVGPGRATGDGPSETRVVAGVSRELLARVVAAVRDAGATLGDVVPAIAALAPVRSVADDAHRTAVVRVHEAGACTIVAFVGDAPVSLRRLPADDATAVEAAVDAAADVAMDATHHAAGRAGRGDRTVRLLDVPAVSVRDAAHGVAAEVAARLAHRAAPVADDAMLAWRDADADEVRRRQDRRGRRRRALFAAGMLLLAAGAVHRAGLQWRLATVRAEREAIVPRLVALGLRGDDPRAGWRAVRAAQARAVSWPAVLGAIAAALPDEAHLTAFRGDTLHVELEGIADDAGAVFVALERAGFDGLETIAPVRRERAVDGTVIDRFVLRARTPRRTVTVAGAGDARTSAPANATSATPPATSPAALPAARRLLGGRTP